MLLQIAYKKLVFFNDMKRLNYKYSKNLTIKIEIVRHYIESLKQWVEQAKSLEESVMQINEKIQTLENIDSNKIFKEEIKRYL